MLGPAVLGTAVLLLASACSSSSTLPGVGPLEGTITNTAGGAFPNSQPTPSGGDPGPSAAGDAFTPSATNQDPAKKIPGIEIKAYTKSMHPPTSNTRVAYDESPPFGGNHDSVWAACNGVVYKSAVRNENMVHTLEHGAVWIAYNPDKVQGGALASLARKVDGQPYTVMSPYPGLDHVVSLQSWGHRLKLDDPADRRVDQFIKSLRQNPYAYPEPGATCDNPAFDQDNPPPFDPTPPGPDAWPVGS